jgi:hypothetical protein
MPFGVLMTVFYLWRRDLLANMLAHSTGTGGGDAGGGAVIGKRTR